MSFEGIEQLLFELSRRNTDMVADMVFREPALFEPLFQIYLRNAEPVSRRAAWVVDLVTEKEPAYLDGLIGQIVDNLPVFNHDGLKRHSLRMLSRAPLPDDRHLGMLISLCFDWLLAPGESVAVKVHAMDILYRASQDEPAIKKELADTIEWRIGEGSPGFRNHGEKVLRKLYSDLRRSEF